MGPPIWVRTGSFGCSTSGCMGFISDAGSPSHAHWAGCLPCLGLNIPSMIWVAMRLLLGEG